MIVHHYIRLASHSDLCGENNWNDFFSNGETHNKIITLATFLSLEYAFLLLINTFPQCHIDPLPSFLTHLSHQASGNYPSIFCKCVKAIISISHVCNLKACVICFFFYSFFSIICFRLINTAKMPDFNGLRAFH